MNSSIAGVELGGTKCVATLADTGGRILQQFTIPTTAPEVTLPELVAVLSRWATTTPFSALGIGSFGPLSLDRAAPDYGHITATAKPGWQSIDVLGILTRHFSVPYEFDTDVNAAALAEQRWGAAQGLDDFAYITIGTGIGVGLIANGRTTRGLSHCELGHIRVARMVGDDWGGICPYHGDCVEGLAAGPAIKARLELDHIHTIPASHAVWELIAHPIALMCHSMLLTTGPRRILIGGGVANGQPHLLPMIENYIRTSIAHYVPLPEKEFVTSPALGDKAGPLGPIALALNKLEDMQTITKS
jgi:fructokinase